MPSTKDYIAQLKEWERERKKVVRMRDGGMKPREIAAKLEISRQRVYQILAKEQENAD